jgi:hypothetical protein
MTSEIPPYPAKESIEETLRKHKPENPLASQATLRDVFAMAAISRWVSAADQPDQSEIIAQDAYKIADAMLRERGYL